MVFIDVEITLSIEILIFNLTQLQIVFLYKKLHIFCLCMHNLIIHYKC